VWCGEWQDPNTLQIIRQIAQLSDVEYNTLKGTAIAEAEKAQILTLDPGPPFEATQTNPFPAWIPITKINLTQILKCTAFGGFHAGNFAFTTETLRWPGDLKPPVTDENVQGWPGIKTPGGRKRQGGATQAGNAGVASFLTVIAQLIAILKSEGRSRDASIVQFAYDKILAGAWSIIEALAYIRKNVTLP